ncbi:MAG: PspA/IM30 family protein [Candidatus Methylacidiphilales bacterium]|nr:PspA/IM30 family protein [Candidatus Methylacidiphilales bacterium]
MLFTRRSAGIRCFVNFPYFNTLTLPLPMFRRLSNIFRGFISLFISGLERQNPEALLEVEKENLRKQIAQYNQGLGQHAGLCERLMSQVRKLEVDERDLRAKTTASLRVNNRDMASQYALRLQTVQRELAENREQLNGAENTYKELVRARDVSIKAAQSKIEALRAGLTDLKIKKATAELNEMASGMISQIGGTGDTLDRLHQMVEEDRQQASGRARVARDALNTTDFAMKEEEQKALADAALADFAAKEGLSFDAPPLAPQHQPGTTESATKNMGPQLQ